MDRREFIFAALASVSPAACTVAPATATVARTEIDAGVASGAARAQGQTLIATFTLDDGSQA